MRNSVCMTGVPCEFVHSNNAYIVMDRRCVCALSQETGLHFVGGTFGGRPVEGIGSKNSSLTARRKTTRMEVNLEFFVTAAITMCS